MSARVDRPVVYYLIRGENGLAKATGKLPLNLTSRDIPHGYIHIRGRDRPEIITEAQYETYRIFNALPEYISPDDPHSNDVWEWCPTCHGYL